MGILRFLLAITVVIGHTSPILGFTFVGAQLAVQTFYIISGFYMALILNEKYVGANGSYKLFLTNRLLRLYPIYWTVLLCTIAYSLMLYIHTDGRDYGRLNMYIRYCHDIGPLSFLYLAFTNIFLFLPGYHHVFGTRYEKRPFVFYVQFPEFPTDALPVHAHPTGMDHRRGDCLLPDCALHCPAKT